MQTKKRLIGSIALKALTVALILFGLIVKEGNLFLEMTYFTYLSNFFVMLMLALFLVFDIRELCGLGRIRTRWLYLLKFTATVGIALTFFVFISIIAPFMQQGFVAAYIDRMAGSLFRHFVGPILAVADFFLFDYEYRPKKHDALLSAIFPALYALFVIILGYAGVTWEAGEGLLMSAPYPFLNFKSSLGWFGINLKDPFTYDSPGFGTFYMILILCAFFLAFSQVFLYLLEIRKKKAGNKKSV